MLKYHNNHDKKCSNDKPGQFKLADCNKKLLTNIVSTNNFLIQERCIFMTYDEYKTDKVHINNNMYCKSFTLEENTIKETIEKELNNIKNNLLFPKSNLQNIPLPIYVMLAKKLVPQETTHVFKGNYEVVLYIPNLMKLSDAEYTLFPSLDSFSKKNRWMELMTSKHSKYLAIIEVSNAKDKGGEITKKNYLKRDLTNS